MGQKSKKKAAAGSASKSKKLDDLTPIVVLPAVNDGDDNTPADAFSTGDAMAGEIRVLNIAIELGILDKQGTATNSSGKSMDMENSKSVLVLDSDVSEAMKVPTLSMEAPVTVKPISINRKVLIDAWKSKLVTKSVSIIGNIQNLDGTGHPVAISRFATSGQPGMVSVMTNDEVEKARNSSMKMQHAEKLFPSTGKDKLKNRDWDLIKLGHYDNDGVVQLKGRVAYLIDKGLLSVLRRFLPEDKVESIEGLSLTVDGEGAVFDVVGEDLDTFLSGELHFILPKSFFSMPRRPFYVYGQVPPVFLAAL